MNTNSEKERGRVRGRGRDRKRSEASDKVEIKALLWLGRDWNGIEVA